MRFVRWSVTALLLAAMLLSGRLVHAQTQPAQVQPLFLGDRACADSRTSCLFPSLVPQHPYLHVVIHDVPNTYQWSVEASSSCDTLVSVAGGDGIPESGYLEKVIDLTSIASAPYPSPLCLVLRGGEGYPNTYYAAYLDDVPTPDADTVYPGYQTLSGRPDLPDIDVTYIRRLPALAYDATPNAPREGQHVTFEAHVVNAGALPAPEFSYRWLMDGRTTLSDHVGQSLAPGEGVTLAFPWRWDAGPHDLELVTEPAQPEIATSNDRLSIRTNALSLGLWVERSAYEYFRDYQWTYCAAFGCGDSDSFEDWAQRQIRAWNGVLSTVSYPDLAPAGIADRIRLDEVVIVPDGTLPLHGYLATNSPDTADHSVDLEWGKPATAVNGYKLNHDGPFNLEWSLIHELGHARSLVDLYRFDVPVTADDSIDVTAADGQPAFNASNPSDASRPLRAFSGAHKNLFLYQNQEDDLMSCDCNHFYSAYDTLALNRIRNRRALCSNTNPPCNMGDWLTEMPRENRLRVVDGQGSPLPDGTEIRLFADTGRTYNGHTFDDSHSTRLQTANGEVTLPPNPFAAGSKDAAGHNLLLIETRTAGADVFCFAEPTTFNSAYWLGYRTEAQSATYTLRLGNQTANNCNLELPPELINEPYATSPYTSRISISPPKGKGRSSTRQVSVRLVDDARPANPMRNRLVAVQDGGGRTLGRGTTGAAGHVSISVRSASGALRIVDVTDNNLVITGQAANPPRSAGRRR